MPVAITFRPIDVWPGSPTRNRRVSDFTAPYGDTLDLLDRELRHLSARKVVIQLALSERDIRNDGLPRSGARPDHPGVILAFDSDYGPLKYATDVFSGGRSSYVGSWENRSSRDAAPGWQCNLRAIALGLEALRKVDRYGITKRGEQYTGWKALPAGIAMPEHQNGFVSPEGAADWLIGRHRKQWPDSWRDDPELFTVAMILDEDDWAAKIVRDLTKRLHPDAGGTTEDFQTLQQAKELVDG